MASWPPAEAPSTTELNCYMLYVISVISWTWVASCNVGRGLFGLFANFEPRTTWLSVSVSVAPLCAACRVPLLLSSIDIHIHVHIVVINWKFRYHGTLYAIRVGYRSLMPNV
jgi:hypothetical protein